MLILSVKCSLTKYFIFFTKIFDLAVHYGKKTKQNIDICHKIVKYNQNSYSHEVMSLSQFQSEFNLKKKKKSHFYQMI